LIDKKLANQIVEVRRKSDHIVYSSGIRNPQRDKCLCTTNRVGEWS